MRRPMTALMLAAVFASPAFANTHKEAPTMQGGASCEAKASEKKLAGAAKTSFMKKCEADAKGGMAKAGDDGACGKQAQEKKLAGAAKTAFLKKCNADAKT